jgi:RNA polymerase subunit RPABC4/transcription elongation factor Spt4
MALERMPRYDISNDGMGPYAIFYCDRCNREYRSNPNIASTVQDNVTRGALGGFLRNVPVIGGAAANQVENDRYRRDMSADDLASAWGATKQYFRECPTCHQIVCIPDFDEPTGFCDEDSPRRAENEAAQAQQAAAALKGVADVFGISGAIQRSAAAAAAASACTNCGTQMAPDARFCPSCGTPAAQPAACANCGTAIAAGVRFCPSCGTPVA